jgi:transketolase
MFDRWRQFVHARKLFRYWLNFVDKRRELVRSDLHFAFDKWKRSHPVKKQQLTVQSKSELNKRAIRNSKVLDKLAEEVSEKETMMDHLNAQRETLLDNYIKSQKLALSTCDSQNKHSIHRAYS